MTGTQQPIALLVLCVCMCVCVCVVCALYVQYYHTRAQYTFIHDALEELITCRETAFNAQDMITRVNKLNSVVAGKGVTGFKEQFDVCILITMRG